ncbi:MAG TPA: AtpZ/AtpI family protein [Candidatus Binataceae bacterium]|nr:AtpZ/AtpI family protein [Candidatus Binataceae bacterium]
MSLDAIKLARYASIGVEFTSPIIAGAILGHYLDAYLHTDPLFTLILFLAGVFTGFYRLIVATRDLHRNS